MLHTLPPIKYTHARERARAQMRADDGTENGIFEIKVSIPVCGSCPPTVSRRTAPDHSGNKLYARVRVDFA